jgi:hypothetical protein
MPVYPGALRLARQNEAAGAADASACPKQAASEIRDKQSTLEP